jgi:hypothetical protein
MKTKELEIALTTYIALEHNQDECSGFIDGYKQCQENMANKKYTEEDIYMALEFGRSHSSMTDKQFIESLNKH